MHYIQVVKACAHHVGVKQTFDLIAAVELSIIGSLQLATYWKRMKRYGFSVQEMLQNKENMI